MDTNKMFIDMAQRAREFAEMCDRMANEINAVKEDHEAWPDDCLKKQSSGVMYERKSTSTNGIEVMGGVGITGKYVFMGLPDDIKPHPKIPHLKERILWLQQREAGTNEVWQVLSGHNGITDIPVNAEPNWFPGFKYRPKLKPTKLIAKIVRNKPMTFDEYEAQIQDFEFVGTPEEYRVECEKYGYAVVSEIKEVMEKPKTVKYCMAMLRYESCKAIEARVFESVDHANNYAKHYACTILGKIEEREAPVLNVNLKGLE